MAAAIKFFDNEANLATDEDDPQAVARTDFPTDVLRHAIKNSTPRMLYKFLKTCNRLRKLAPMPLPFFFIKKIVAGVDGDIEYLLPDGQIVEVGAIEEIPENLFILDSVSSGMPIGTFFVSHLIPKIAVCNIKLFVLEDEEILMDEFKFLSGKVKILQMERTMIFNANGIMVQLEDILACIPAIEEISISSCVPSFSGKAAANNIILVNLKKYYMHYVMHNFDAEAFIEFMKNHKTVKYILQYHHLTTCPFPEMMEQYINDNYGDDVEAQKYPYPELLYPEQV